ncbi:MAG: hypothetical protein JSR45_08695 [Proteobacteria bacterium]|nr:hypothetical protein [Pseudomonadota bacterium]
MIRTFVLLLAALSLVTTPATAFAPKRKDAHAATSHGKKGAGDEDCAQPTKAKGKHAPAKGKKPAACKNDDGGAKHGKGKAAASDDQADDCAPAKPAKGHGKHAPAKKASASCGKGAAGKSASSKAALRDADDSEADCAPIAAKPARGRGKHAAPKPKTGSAACRSGKGREAAHDGGDDQDCAPAPKSAKGRGKHAPAKGHAKAAPAACHGAKGRGSASRDTDDEQDCAPAPNPAKGRGRHAPAKAKKASTACHKGRGDNGERDSQEDCTPAPAVERASSHAAKGKAAHGKPAKGRHAAPTKASHGHKAAPAQTHCVRKADTRGKTREAQRAAPVYIPPQVYSVRPEPKSRFQGMLPTPQPDTPVVTQQSAPPAAIVRRNPPPGVVVENQGRPDPFGFLRPKKPRPATASHMTLATLLDRTDADLRTSLGEPDLKRSEGDGALWTYRLPDCSLMVFLHRSAGAAWKVSGAQTGPLERGQAAPEVDACLRTAAGKP